jgi:hypothetical protein
MKKILPLFLFIITVIERSAAQGCSDAGFCTIPYHSSTVSKADKKLKNSITTDITFGLGEGNSKALTASILYRRVLNNKLSWDNKITASYFTGSLGNIFNLGDWYSTVNYTVQRTKKTTISFIGGVKIPFTVANDKIKGQPLPMAYQTSLGTYDLLAGAAWIIKNKIDINAAIQAPLVNVNKNTFFKEYSSEMDFESTNNFERKPDVLLRLGYILETKNKKWTFRPNALAIAHLGEDSYENIFGDREDIDGSSGLTINLNLQGQYKIAQQKAIGFSIASPVIVRENRPDGLTRSLILSLNYLVGF